MVGHRRCLCVARMGGMRAAAGVFRGPTAPLSPAKSAGRWVPAQLRPSARRSRRRRRATAAPDNLGYFAVRGALERAFSGRCAGTASEMHYVFRYLARASKGSVTRQWQSSSGHELIRAHKGLLVLSQPTRTFAAAGYDTGGPRDHIR